jgi:hypothetical protein
MFCLPAVLLIKGRSGVSLLGSNRGGGARRCSSRALKKDGTVVLGQETIAGSSVWNERSVRRRSP